MAIEMGNEAIVFVWQYGIEKHSLQIIVHC